MTPKTKASRQKIGVNFSCAQAPCNTPLKGKGSAKAKVQAWHLYSITDQTWLGHPLSKRPKLLTIERMRPWPHPKATAVMSGPQAQSTDDASSPHVKIGGFFLQIKLWLVSEGEERVTERAPVLLGFFRRARLPRVRQARLNSSPTKSLNADPDPCTSVFVYHMCTMYVHIYVFIYTVYIHICIYIYTGTHTYTYAYTQMHQNII